MAEYVALAKKNPDAVTMGGGVVGVQLAAERFMRDAGVKGLTVQYRGDAPAYTELLAGRIDATLTAISTAASDNHINAKEAEHIRGVWDELKRFTEGFVRLCEKGDFAHLADEIKTHQGHR